MTRTTLRAKGQLTLPEDIRTAAHLQEGDLLDAVVTAEGILLRPQTVIDSTQAWFWTSDWQSGERDAENDKSEVRIESFESGSAFIEALKAESGVAVASGKPAKASGTRRNRASR